MTNNLEALYRQIGRQYVLNYAAIGSGLGKLKPKKCKKGWECGYSCQGKDKKNCNSAVGGQAKTYAEWLSSQASKPKPSKPASSKAKQSSSLTPERSSAAKITSVTPLTKDEYKAELKKMKNVRGAEDFTKIVPAAKAEAMIKAAQAEFDKMPDSLKRDLIDFNGSRALSDAGRLAADEMITEHHIFTGNANSVGAANYRKIIIERLGREHEQEYFPPSSATAENITLEQLRKAKVGDGGPYDPYRERAARAAVKADIDINQSYTRETLGDRFTLHRGVTADQAEAILRQFPNLKEGDEIELPVNALSSWTSSTRVASDFAKNKYDLVGGQSNRGIVLSRDFTPDDIAFNGDLSTRYHESVTYKSRSGYELGVMSASETIKVKVGKIY